MVLTFEEKNKIVNRFIHSNDIDTHLKKLRRKEKTSAMHGCWIMQHVEMTAIPTKLTFIQHWSHPQSRFTFVQKYWRQHCLFVPCLSVCWPSVNNNCIYNHLLFRAHCSRCFFLEILLHPLGIIVKWSKNLNV